MPSSTTTAVLLSRGIRPRPARNRSTWRSSSTRSLCSTTVNSSTSRPAPSTSSSITRTPSSLIAPIASSGWEGNPSLRTTMTSSGAPSVLATSKATGTPPRGSPRTTTSSSAWSPSFSLSCLPASDRSRNAMSPPLPDGRRGRSVSSTVARRRRSAAVPKVTSRASPLRGASHQANKGRLALAAQPLRVNSEGNGRKRRTAMDSYKLFINGEFVDARSGDTFESVDPGSGAVIAHVARAGTADAEDAIGAARRALDQGEGSGLAPDVRARRCYEFADQVAAQTLRLALMESMDSGQVIGLSKFWGMLASGTLRNLGYHAATKFPWEEEIPFSGNFLAPGREYIRREPIGVCVGIIPWNFPIAMASWKIAHAIVMGNTIVLKPASLTSITALIMAEAAQAAGIPPGVINVIPGSGAELGETLCTHPDVDKIAFTGSTVVGSDIMRMASGTVKKVTLELGGKSANIILDDADMELAVEGAIFGTFFHQGQVCESGTRVLVSGTIYDEFVERMPKRADQLQVGYQLLPTTHQGPLVSAGQLATVEGYVQVGIDEGAELVTGGRRVRPEGFEEGYYYAPTIFANVRNDMRIAQEEIFGPVVCLERFDTDEEAVAIANDSMYGLAGGVFSNNNARAERIARQVRTGTMWINNFHIFGDFAPFGGYKQSGVGREFGGSGLEEYTQVKRIHLSGAASLKANFQMVNIFSDDPRMDALQYKAPTNVIAGHGTLAGR